MGPLVCKGRLHGSVLRHPREWRAGRVVILLQARGQRGCRPACPFGRGIPGGGLLAAMPPHTVFFSPPLDTPHLPLPTHLARPLSTHFLSHPLLPDFFSSPRPHRLAYGRVEAAALGRLPARHFRARCVFLFRPPRHSSHLSPSLTRPSYFWQATAPSTFRALTV